MSRPIIASTRARTCSFFCSRLARSAGLEVHAGHGLDYATAEKIAGLVEIVELNIGYYMIGEALFVGLGETVRQMRAAMDRGRNAIEGAGKGAAKGTAKP